MTYFGSIKKLRSYEKSWVFDNFLLSRTSLIRKSGTIMMRRLSTYCNLLIFTWKITKIARKLVYPALIVQGSHLAQRNDIYYIIWVSQLISKFDLHGVLDFWLLMTLNDLETNSFQIWYVEFWNLTSFYRKWPNVTSNET